MNTKSGHGYDDAAMRAKLKKDAMECRDEIHETLRAIGNRIDTLASGEVTKEISLGLERTLDKLDYIQRVLL